VTVTVYPSASEWWFAVTIAGVDAGSIASVEMTDSGSVSNAILSNNDWGFALSAPGSPFIAPITVRITNEQGATATATVASITPGKAFTASGSL